MSTTPKDVLRAMVYTQGEALNCLRITTLEMGKEKPDFTQAFEASLRVTSALENLRILQNQINRQAGAL